ncbi:molybdopterin-synthase adenylyltransferase MoeB [Carboxydochorda subterranea]|uniref:Molybdopterin-synthase adenylyltransferase MoeB n=1 Tax=Carboxydichorda subterranea TaxID=3109565 RepID=A0ABZ1C031_9FIRM|nr:molybdopterin-synthase adenylyltransferase MoeB [Limnochorda sp. L945t]WRP18136.1 molybdopterin-synthase adenylyltransferase MoeB [Limnochorda sp. L945t]
MRGVPLLTGEQMQRYSRQILLQEVGVEGQRKLLESRVLIVGAGGLGSPTALYLAAAGVGTLGIVDGDRVDLTNLQRQILHFTHDVGRPKTQSARRTLEDVNPEVEVRPYQTVLTSDNAMEILRDYDVVVNGCDNFPTRYLVNDACVLLGKPLVDASILRWEGQATTYLPGHGCYRCLFPTPPPPGSVPSCADAGIIGALAGFFGTLQALEAVKVLLGIGETLVNRLLLFDALAADIRVVRYQRDPACPVCGDHPTVTRLIDYEEFCGVPHRHPAPQAQAQQAAGSGDGPAGEATPAVDGGVAQLSPPDVWKRVQEGGVVLLDVREKAERDIMRIEGSLWIPLGELPQRLHELPKGRDLVAYCAVGERSARAVALLRRSGWERAFNLQGGIIAWLNHQLPVEGPSS